MPTNRMRPGCAGFRSGCILRKIVGRNFALLAARAVSGYAHGVLGASRIEMSGTYLLKTEPSEYSFADLQRDGATAWDGVSNPTAVKNLREMKPGAKLVIYETGDRRTAVGTASVVSVDATDLKKPIVKIKAGKPIAKPVSLADLKSHKLFATSPLVKIGRLSVVPLTDAQYDFLTGV
jgi:predicted RNA-binding protein with PUA-like domain